MIFMANGITKYFHQQTKYPVIYFLATPKSHHFERNRVHAAVLKLADGDLLDLQRQVAVADADFREVVGAAEYPAQMKIGFVGMERIGPDRLHELRELDWQEYSAWLARA
jgi:hypothetical protein